MMRWHQILSVLFTLSFYKDTQQHGNALNKNGTHKEINIRLTNQNVSRRIRFPNIDLKQKCCTGEKVCTKQYINSKYLLLHKD